jgi:hypothetical protein
MSFLSTFSNASVRNFRIIPSSSNRWVLFQNFIGWNFDEFISGKVIFPYLAAVGIHDIFAPTGNPDYPKQALPAYDSAYYDMPYAVNFDNDNAETKKIENVPDFNLKLIPYNRNSVTKYPYATFKERMVYCAIWIDVSDYKKDKLFYYETTGNFSGTTYNFVTNISGLGTQTNPGMPNGNFIHWARIIAISSENTFGDTGRSNTLYGKRWIACGNSSTSTTYSKEFNEYRAISSFYDNSFGGYVNRTNYAQWLDNGFVQRRPAGNVAPENSIFATIAINENKKVSTLTNIAECIRNTLTNAYTVRLMQLKWEKSDFYVINNPWPNTQFAVKQIGQDLTFTNVKSLTINSGPQGEFEGIQFSTIGLRICVTDKISQPENINADENGFVRITNVWEITGGNGNEAGNTLIKVGNDFFTGKNDEHTHISANGNFVLADSVNSRCCIFKLTNSSWNIDYTFPQQLLNSKFIARWNGDSTAVLVFEYTSTQGLFTIYKNDGTWSKFGDSFTQLAEDVGSLPTLMRINLTCTRLYTIFQNSGKRLYTT